MEIEEERELVYVEPTEFKPFPTPPYKFSRHPFAPTIASASYNVVLWDLNTCAKLKELEVGTFIFDLSFSPTGTHILFVTINGIRLWNVETGELKKLSPYPLWMSAWWHPSGTSFVVLPPTEKIIKAVSADDFSVVHDSHVISDRKIDSLSFSPSGAKLVACCGNELCVFHWPSFETLARKELGGNRRSTVIANDRFIICDNKKSFDVFDWDLNFIHTSGEEEDAHQCIRKFSLIEDTLAVFDFAGRAKVLDISNDDPFEWTVKFEKGANEEDTLLGVELVSKDTLVTVISKKKEKTHVIRVIDF